MSATPDSTLAEPERLIADLQRQLAECKAERDEGDRQDRQASCQPAQVAGGFDNKGYRGHQGWPESGSLPRFLEVF